MAKKKLKPPDPGPSNAYLMSFGDTMTTLLAFFIVLNSLAEEQTGANLYRGSGSFVRAMQSHGVPGSFSGNRSSNAVPRHATSPLYLVPSDDDQEPSRNARGPDEEDDGLRVINREQDDFERFLVEMERLAEVSNQPETQGEAVFDYFKLLNREPPYLTDGYREMFAQVIPLLHQEKYNVEIIVWATTPSPSAWTRAVNQSHAIRDRILETGGVPSAGHARLRAVGRPWFHSKAKRPVLSVVVRKSGA